VRLASLMAKENRVSAVEDVGFVFDSVAPTGGVKAQSFEASWPSARVSGVWMKNAWQISFDGSLHRDAQTKALLTPRTVVLQFAEHRESAYGDRFGGKTPLVKTIGSGRAIVLRNGQSYEAQWIRPAKDAGTTFTIGEAPLPFDVGQVMIVLVDQKAKKGDVKVAK